MDRPSASLHAVDRAFCRSVPSREARNHAAPSRETGSRQAQRCQNGTSRRSIEFSTEGSKPPEARWGGARGARARRGGPCSRLHCAAGKRRCAQHQAQHALLIRCNTRLLHPPHLATAPPLAPLSCGAVLGMRRRSAGRLIPIMAHALNHAAPSVNDLVKMSAFCFFVSQYSIFIRSESSGFDEKT